MKKYKNSVLILESIFLTFFFFGIELIFRVVENFSIFDFATLRIFFSCAFISILLEFFLSFLRKQKTRIIIQEIFLFLVTIYAFAQAGFKNFLGLYVSVGTSGQVSAVKSYIVNFLTSFPIEYYLIWIPFILYSIFVFLKKKGIKKAKFTWTSRLFTFLASLFFFFGYLFTLILPFMQNKLQLIPNKTLFLVPTNSSIAVNQFGVSIYGLIDVRHNFFPIELPSEDFEKNNQNENQLREIDDSLWLQIIKSEKNSSKNTLNRYFQSRVITQPNDYTGYFEGKNVIVIMMESINNVIENKEYFPNFSKMLEHGWYWENNYSPRNACATGDNEFSGMTSLYPINTSCTVNITPDNTYFTSIFNQFKNKGYYASSYHDLDSAYYPREIFHKNMGSEAYYDGHDLGLDFDSSNYLEWPSDVEFIELASEIFTKNTPFVSWLTTVTAHQPYDESSIYGDYYYDLFEDTDYPDTLKRYLSKAKITDDALGKLMNLLEEKDMLSDTVIVLYGDHYPYGLSNKDVALSVDYDIEDFFEIERTPFLIYNSELEPKIYKEKTFYMNILPTIANLFDLDYDPRFYMGEDLFDPNFSSRVVFQDGSWEDNIARYNAIDSSITYFDEEITYTIEEIQKINKDIYNKKAMSKLAIETNYFEYLEKKKEELQKERIEENEQINDRGISTQE